jgi:hypothetical protein
VLQPGALLPDGSKVVITQDTIPGPCSMEVPELTPSLRPRYAIAYPSSPCRAVDGFAPVHFRTWLPPVQRTARVVWYEPGSRGR